MSAMFVYITTKDAAEAGRIGRALVEERLAACANILENMRSIYRWEGKIVEDSEAVLVAKTTKNRVAELTERVKALHSYTLPCVIALPIEAGNAPYLEWIAKETA